MIDVAEGQRLKAAAEKAWETYVNISGGDEHAEYLEVEKTSEAWEKWRDANIDALLDAAERTEAAERELSEAREDSARLDWLDARQPTFAVGRGPSGEWAVFGPTNIGGCGYSDVRAAIDAERGKR